MKNIAILGSTGSIGKNTLAVIREHSHLYNVTVLVGGYQVDVMLQQCIEFQPKYVAMADENTANKLYTLIKSLNLPIEVFAGMDSICQLAALDEVDYVMSAIVGAYGMLPTLSAIQAKKRILLANKESLVTCGRIFMDALKQYKTELLPVDSEHSAIFQCLSLEAQQQLGSCVLFQFGVKKIILTGSGGPFREKPLNELINVTPEQACHHPNWSMGKKISIDSATMMNKGLEYIEARWLFNASKTEIEVLLHPQSIIHSMVRYCDGNVMAQLGSPDMRGAISYALSYPNRITTTIPDLNFCQLMPLTFAEVDFSRYPCLRLAIDAFDCGQATTTLLNAANEISVMSFLQSKIKFTDIAKINELIMDSISFPDPETIDEVLAIDKEVRVFTQQIIKERYRLN